MAILHTGQGFFRQADFGFKPSDLVKDLGDDLVKIEQYRQQLQMQWEQEFLKMTSVDMENLVFDQFQLEAKKQYDKFMDESTQIWKSKKGVLSTEDKMKVIRSQQAIQGQISMMKSKAKQFLEVKDTLEKDGGYRYDPALMKEEMDNFVKDPLNNPVPTLKARPVDLVQHMLKDAPKWKPDATEKYVEIGTGQYEKHMERERFGIKTEEDYREWLNNFLKYDQKAGYAFSTPYYNRDLDGIIEWTKDEILPYPFERTSISSSVYKLNTGGSGTVGWSNTTDPQLGEIINATGNVPPFSLNIGGELKTVTLRAVGEKGIKVDYPEVVPDMSVKGLDLSQATHPFIEAERRVQGGKPIQGKDGLWYPSKTVTSPIVIGKDEAELSKYYSDIEKAIRAGKNTDAEGYLKAWNKFKADVEQKKKAVSSQPKKQIKRGDIKAKAKAAGYSEAEYTEMLKKNNIEIVD